MPDPPPVAIDMSKARPIRRTGTVIWHDFTALIEGTYKPALPAYGFRSDDVALFYPGREHALYGETESGKSMLEVMTVRDCLIKEQAVVVIDFEEGDELTWGSRLLEAYLPTGLLRNDAALFRYGTPASKEEANAMLKDAISMEPALIIFEGVTAAYGIYGWAVKENDSATQFRSHLVRPSLAAGIATLSSDHVTKSEGRSRYALGGVMKLNMVNGAAYLLESVKPFTRGGRGESRLFVTKDRPGAVKPNCKRVKDEPAMMNAGLLIADSATGMLNISIEPPEDTEHIGSGISEKLKTEAWEFIKGRPGCSANAMEHGVKGKATAIRAAREELEYEGLIRSEDAQGRTGRAYYVNEAAPIRMPPEGGTS